MIWVTLEVSCCGQAKLETYKRFGWTPVDPKEAGVIASKVVTKFCFKYWRFRRLDFFGVGLASI